MVSSLFKPPGRGQVSKYNKAELLLERTFQPSEQFVKMCKICQQYKKRRKYGHVPAKTIEDLMPWRTMHIDLIGPYSITAKQTQPSGKIKEIELQLTTMTMVDPAMGWFEIVEVPYNVEDIVNNKEYYIDKSSARISQLFNQVWLSQ